jgi:hypothetical protein
VLVVGRVCSGTWQQLLSVFYALFETYFYAEEQYLDITTEARPVLFSYTKLFLVKSGAQDAVVLRV